MQNPTIHHALLVTRTALAAGALAVAGASAQVVDLPARDVALQPTLQSVYRVGRIEGERWELYGNQVEVAFDGSGNLHVFDRQNFRIVVVDTRGKLVRVVGQRGDGPGEIRAPHGFAVLRDGTIAVADVGQRAFLLYDRTGAFQRSVTFGSDAFTSLGVLQVDPRGGSLISAGHTLVLTQAPGDGGFQRVRGAAAEALADGRPIVRYPLTAGTQPRTLHFAWLPPKPETPQAASGAAVLPLAGRRAFEPKLYTAVLPDGMLVVSDSSAYAFKLIGPDGAVRRTLRRPVRPQRVTAAMQRAERERLLAERSASGAIVLADRGGGAGPSQQQIQEIVRQGVEQMPFYPELPVVTGLAAGWAGKIWVGRSPMDGSGNGPVDVIDATGKYLGTIAPSGPRIPNAFGPDGLVAYVERDQFDVVSIAVRRLPPELR